MIYVADRTNRNDVIAPKIVFIVYYVSFFQSLLIANSDIHDFINAFTLKLTTAESCIIKKLLLFHSSKIFVYNILF